MDLGLKGKVALITAASKGLGRACALGFAREGASVAICSRDEAALEATANEIREATGAQVLAIRADVTRAEEIQQVVERTAAQFGRIDTLVCNAGGPPGGTFEQISDEQWQAGIDLNLLSVIRLIRVALPYLKESGSGRIISLASSSVKQPIPALIISNTLRLGLQGLVKSCSDEFAPYGILINTVAPGRFATDRVRSLDIGRAQRAGITLEQQIAKTEKEIAVGRYGDPEEFARYVTFLGSPANTYVTGQALLVDGGYTRGI